MVKLLSRIKAIEIRLKSRLQKLERSKAKSSLLESPFSKVEMENLDRYLAFTRLDLTDHNSSYSAPVFSPLVSQAVTAMQFSHPEYIYWANELGFADESKLVTRGTTESIFNRKVWEWAYVLQAAKQFNLLKPGLTAIGFGVGNEPVPAVLAKYGIQVLATDQDSSDSTDWSATGQWTTSGQILTGLSGLFRPSIIPNEKLSELVRVRRVDMNFIPADLGQADLIWSSCALEHLGSPELGMDFVLSTARLLAPGGIAVHTTELDLTRQDKTVDWGHLACYRPDDFRGLAKKLKSEGFEMDLNFTIPLDTPEDRWISMALRHGPNLAAGELSHLKVEMFDSVCTSFGLLIRRPF